VTRGIWNAAIDWFNSSAPDHFIILFKMSSLRYFLLKILLFYLKCPRSDTFHNYIDNI